MIKRPLILERAKERISKAEREILKASRRQEIVHMMAQRMDENGLLLTVDLEYGDILIATLRHTTNIH